MYVDVSCNLFKVMLYFTAVNIRKVDSTNIYLFNTFFLFFPFQYSFDVFGQYTADRQSVCIQMSSL